jgi:hypothetical protein
MSAPRRFDTRRVAFIALCAAAIGGSGVYLSMARVRARPIIARGVVPDVRMPSGASSIRRQPYIAFRNLAAGADYGALAFAALDDAAGRRYSTTLPCNRVYAQNETTVCIVAEPVHRRETLGFVLDTGLRVTRTWATDGAPSRARMSRDGRRAAYTVFVVRDSYMASGFSTRTRIVDLTSDAAPLDLETFDAMRDGAPLTGTDFNFWGVTFTADSNRFYATLATNGHEYLVRGDVAARRVDVIHDGVECPSVSPDGTHIAFNKKVAPVDWRPGVLDLASGTEIVLPETHNVDDQIEWLDDAHVLYGVRERRVQPVRANVWMLPIDGSGAPALFLADAESPSVHHP